MHAFIATKGVHRVHTATPATQLNNRRDPMTINTRANPQLRPTRRRVLQLTAAASASALTSLLTGSALAGHSAVHWRGTALGARSTVTLYGRVKAEAEAALAGALRELQRLERIFSLYDPASSLVRLNRSGTLDSPPQELVQLLSEAKTYSELTGGAFDVTMQALWQLYADHFARAPADAAGPDERALAEALARVDYRAVRIAQDRLAFGAPGMAISLNGIAQGFVTDRVATVLAGSGFAHALVNLGEIRALGTHPSGRPWRIGITDPDSDTLMRRLPISGAAVATSGPAGHRFEDGGRFNHLIDPRSGACAARYVTMTVTAPTATRADALSTAFSLMAWDEVASLCARLDGVNAHGLAVTGQWHST